MRIGVKLVLGFLAVSWLMAGTGYYAIVTLQEVSLNDIGRGLQEQAALTVREADEHIYHRVHELQAYLQDTSMVERAIRSNREFALIEDLQNHIQTVDQAWTEGKETPFIQEILQGELSTALKQHFDHVNQAAGYPVIAEAYVTNGHGVIIAATPRTTDYLQADERSWQQALAGNDDIWIDSVEFDDSSGSLSMGLVCPLRDDDGRMIGMFKAALNIHDVQRMVELLQTESHYRSARAYLVDKHGRAIFTSWDPAKKQPGHDVSLEQYGADFSSRKVVAEALKVGNGFLVCTDARKDVLGVFCRSESYGQYDGLSWTLVAEYDVDEVLKNVLAAKRFLLVISVVATLLAIVGGFLLSRSISMRISRLTVAAGELAEGALDARIEGIPGHDEIGLLCERFNHMAQRLQQGERELRRSRDELEVRIEEQKRAKEEREKLIAELEAQNHELERFAYTISHDLRSPLITIKGFLGVLQNDAAEGNAEQFEDHIARIANAADTMGRLLADILELSRIGRVASDPEDVPLADLAYEAVDLVSGRIAERNIRVEIAPDLPVLHGDRVRLYEVVQNLLENAVKYMGDQADPCIEIGSRRCEKETVCYVRDNGIGVKPQYHKRIFDLFDQLDQKIEGSGVGLALVKRIVEIHGGRVWVESEGPGNGSTFCFTIPPASDAWPPYDVARKP